MALKRSLGVVMLTFYGIGMILGAGIYSIIGQAAGRAGDNLWLSFALAALAAAITALSYAELATMFSTAGAEYVYLRHAFPSQQWIAAIMGIMMTFAGSATAATVSLAFASYLKHFAALPNLWAAAAVLAFFTGVNILGIKQSSWINAIFTIIEISGLVLFIFLGWQAPDFGKALFSAPGYATISGAALVIFAYFGFENIVNLAEETREPGKTLPRAILFSLAISTGLYILVSLAAVALLPPEELSRTESPLTAAAVSTSSRAAGVLGGIALFSTANTALIALLTTSRILYGVAKDGALPRILSKTHSKLKTPWVAALIAFAIAMSLLPLESVEAVGSISAFATMIAFIAVNVALISLRFTKPRTRRPFRVPFSFRRIPISTLFGIAVCSVFLLQFNAMVYAIGLAAFGFAAIVYWLTSLSRREVDVASK